MIETIAGVSLGVLALLSWVYSVYHWLALLGHRKPEIALSTLFFRGAMAFDESNFTEAGQPHVRGMKRGFVAFFALILIGMLVVFVVIGAQG